MKSTLKNIVHFASVAPGASASAPHLLLENGNPVKPDVIHVPTGFEATADDVVVTVTNNGSAVADCDVLAEHWHTNERAMPADPLTPQPFKAGGNGAVHQDAFNHELGLPNNNDPVTVENIIYVRTTGDDTTGDGSLAKPYRTFVRACNDVPRVTHNTIWTIDITGITEYLPMGFQMPTLVGSFPFRANLFTFPPVEMPIIVVAQPKLASLIPASNAELSGAELFAGGPVVDPATLLVTFTTSKTFVPGELVGKFLKGNINVDYAPITANGVNSITVAVDIVSILSGWYVIPDGAGINARIVEPSADLFAQPDHTFDYALTDLSLSQAGITSSNVGIAWSGIKFTLTDLATRPDGYIFHDGGEGGGLVFALCELNGGADFAGSILFMAGCNYFGQRFRSDGPNVNLINMYAKDVIFWQCAGPVIGYMRACYFDGCNSIGAVAPRLLTDPFISELQAATMLGSMLLWSVHIKNSIQAGYLSTGGDNTLWHVLIEDSAWAGIMAQGAGNLVLAYVQGTGNAELGVRADGGHQVRVSDDDTTITGALGDMQVGNKATRTWADFRANAPVKNEPDFSGDTATGTRLYQQTMYWNQPAI